MSAQDSYIPIKVENTDNKCDLCTRTICCTYFTQALDTPRTRDDFDHMLWQMTHQNTQVYKDEDGWFLLVNNPCQFLGEDGRCTNYENRPQLCRDYKNDYCEYDAPAEDGFELFFENYEALLKYCRKRFKSWDKRFTED